MATRSLQRLARVTQTGASWNRAWERPFCAPACFPITVSLETKGPFSLGLDAAISGWQCQVVGASGGVNLLSPPTLRSSGARCWGGGCSMLCCHGNHPNPHLPKHKERQLSPPPPSQEEPGSGWESSLGNPLSAAQAMAAQASPSFQSPEKEGGAARGSGQGLARKLSPLYLTLSPLTLSCTSPTAKAIPGLFS